MDFHDRSRSCVSTQMSNLTLSQENPATDVHIYDMVSEHSNRQVGTFYVYSGNLALYWSSMAPVPFVNEIIIGRWPYHAQGIVFFFPALRNSLDKQKPEYNA